MHKQAHHALRLTGDLHKTRHQRLRTNHVTTSPESTTFKTEETYTPEGGYNFRNSPEGVRRLPFPSPDDDSISPMNLKPHVPAGDGPLKAAFDIDEHYVSECAPRDQMLPTCRACTTLRCPT